MGSMNIIMLDPANYTPWYNRALCAALVETGISIHLLTSANAYEAITEPETAYIQNIFYRVASALKLKGKLRRIIGAAEHPFDWLAVIARLYTSPAPTIIHTQWLPLPGIDIYMLKLAKYFGLALVHTVHNLEPHLEGRGRIEDFSRLYNLVDGLIVHTSQTAKGLTTEFGVPANRIFLVPHGTIGEQYKPVDRRKACNLLGLAADDRAILFFGTLRREKGLPTLIEAFPKIVHHHPKAKLVIAGRQEGISSAEINSLLSKFGVSPSHICTRLAYIPSEQLPVYFGAAELSVYPYQKADQSGSLMLSMTLGVPAVVSQVGGLPDIVHDGVNGRVVQSNDPDALAAAIIELLDLPTDALSEMGKRGKRIAEEEYAWPKIAKQTIEAYQGILKTRN